jgi:hypothetical protein
LGGNKMVGPEGREISPFLFPSPLLSSIKQRTALSSHHFPSPPLLSFPLHYNENSGRMTVSN